MKIAKRTPMAEKQLQNLVSTLRRGGVIAFPTETVYALAGDARNLSTIKRIFELKNRPLNQALSVLLSDSKHLEEWTNDIPLLAKRLADSFWPGPMTLVFNKKASVLAELTGGGTKVGLRVPDHPFAQCLLRAFGGGLAAPSANRTEELSATHADQVRQTFGGRLDAIIDGGPCSIGIESTIIDVSGTIPRILRLGAISQEAIQSVINLEIQNNFVKVTQKAYSHLKLIVKAELKNAVSHYLSQGDSITVLAKQSATMCHPNLFWISMPEDASDYARVLYQYLHEAEKNSTNHILIESLPQNSSWEGIRALLVRYGAD